MKTNSANLFQKNFKIVITTLISTVLFQGCMTSARQNQLQSSINDLKQRITQIQEQLNKRDQQINNTTQSAISSQNEVENLQTQLQLTQGAIDELKVKIKRIEENALGSTNEQNELSLNKQAELLTKIQRQLAKIELITKPKSETSHKGKLSLKLQTSSEINKTLKKHYEQGHFQQVVDISNSIINAQDATNSMIQTATEYRAEAKFKLQDYLGAAIDFSNLIAQYPNTPKYSRALLLAGDSFVYLKNNSMAKSYYQECAKSFPTLPEGKAASERLSSLNAQISSSHSKDQ